VIDIDGVDGPICAREQDVLDLVATGRWPARASVELAAHVASCASCADLAAVALAVTDLRDATSAQVRVPDAGLVWYRAQLQAREDAARRAARPLLAAQAAGLVLLAAALTIWSGGLGGLVAGALSDAWTSFTGLLIPTAPLADIVEQARQSAAPALLRGLALVTIAALLVLSLAVGLSRLADRGES
jgi:hypothetical protein